MPERYDAIIIGTGPAGLSAAVTLTIRNKKILVFGSSRVSEKVEKAAVIQNYLGLPDMTGAEMKQRFLSHVERLGIEIRPEQVTCVYAMGEYFALQTRSDIMYEASAVILATGVSFGKPYPGEEQFLGRGVSYCATCDAPLYKGKTAAIIAASDKEVAEAEFMSEICEKVYYIPVYKTEPSLNPDIKNIEVIREKPKAITGMFKANKLVLDTRELDVDGVFILRDSVAPDKMVPGLEMDGNHVKVNRKMETSLSGLFACGDITGTPYQYIKAAGEGNVAALSAVAWLSANQSRS